MYKYALCEEAQSYVPRASHDCMPLLKRFSFSGFCLKYSHISQPCTSAKAEVASGLCDVLKACSKC